MPLQRLHLKNFRLFQDKTLKFSDGINLILGENGSGKTTVLESLNILLTGNSLDQRKQKNAFILIKNFIMYLQKVFLKAKIFLLLLKIIIIKDYSQKDCLESCL